MAERAQDMEVTIPGKKGQKTQYNFDVVPFFETRSWGRRPDGNEINGGSADRINFRI